MRMCMNRLLGSWHSAVVVAVVVAVASVYMYECRYSTSNAYVWMKGETRCITFAVSWDVPVVRFGMVREHAKG